jgi:hypothetical protein
VAAFYGDAVGAHGGIKIHVSGGTLQRIAARGAIAAAHLRTRKAWLDDRFHSYFPCWFGRWPGDF